MTMSNEAFAAAAVRTPAWPMLMSSSLAEFNKEARIHGFEFSIETEECGNKGIIQAKPTNPQHGLSLFRGDVFFGLSSDQEPHSFYLTIKGQNPSYVAKINLSANGWEGRLKNSLKRWVDKQKRAQRPRAVSEAFVL